MIMKLVSKLKNKGHIFMSFDSKQIAVELKNGLLPFSEINNISHHPGIYAIGYCGDNFPFPTGENVVNNGDIIYIGKTEKSLKSRDAHTHFKSGKTGSSTLRRSLGAVLINDLDLKPIPRSASETRMRNYKFIEESENQLTDWMIKNLTLSFYIIHDGKRIIRRAEFEIIKAIEPILNITHNSTGPYVSMLKELRKKCKLIAKEQGQK